MICPPATAKDWTPIEQPDERAAQDIPRALNEHQELFTK